ncbi:MAG: DUF5615 family PIN-like protein [Candidatus Acidiferrales bacterium]
MMIRFLVDADVNQKAVRSIPAHRKGFDFLYLEAGSFKQAEDTPVRKLATMEARVLVTGDKDFSRYNLSPHQVPHGVLWLRPPRAGQKRVAELIQKFCSFLQRTFPEAPYKFGGRMFEIHEDRVIITDSGGSTTYPLESD